MEGLGQASIHYPRNDSGACTQGNEMPDDPFALLQDVILIQFAITGGRGISSRPKTLKGFI